MYLLNVIFFQLFCCHRILLVNKSVACTKGTFGMLELVLGARARSASDKRGARGAYVLG